MNNFLLFVAFLNIVIIIGLFFIYQLLNKIAIFLDTILIRLRQDMEAMAALEARASAAVNASRERVQPLSKPD